MKERLQLIWLVLMFAADYAGGCTLWGFNPVGGNTVGSEDIISEAAAEQLAHMQLQGGSGDNWPWCNDSGWGLSAYSAANPGELPLTQVWRGSGPAYGDALYDSLETVIVENSDFQVQQLLAHMRSASSGATGIPNPHPFIERRAGADLAFIHNGTLNKAALRELLGEEWLQLYPPQTWIEEDWTTAEGWAQVVDSELYFFWILKNIEEQGGNLQLGIQQALYLMRQLSGDRNFLLTDGADIYAYRGSGPSGATPEPPQLWFRTGRDIWAQPLYHAVTSLPADTSSGIWGQVASDMLVVLPAVGEVRLRSGFSLEPAGEGLLCGITVRNFPNPFSSSTTIAWESEQSGELRIVIHDILGRKVVELYHGQTGQGEGSCSWNGQGSSGTKVASGLYILRVTLNRETIHHRMLLVR